MKKLACHTKLFSVCDKGSEPKPGDLIIITSFVPEDHESIGILLVNDSPIENDKTYKSCVLIHGAPRMINDCFIFPIDIDA